MRDEEMFAIARVGHCYLFDGAYELATSIFEGLLAMSPRQPYFALALGLARDRSGDRLGAHRMYARASELDPCDARPDVNRAELFLEEGNAIHAAALLRRAIDKAHRARDRELLVKASTMLDHLRSRVRRAQHAAGERREPKASRIAGERPASRAQGESTC